MATSNTDSQLTVLKEDKKLLQQLAKAETRALKGQFSHILREYAAAYYKANPQKIIEDEL